MSETMQKDSFLLNK